MRGLKPKPLQVDGPPPPMAVIRALYDDLEGIRRRPTLCKKAFHRALAPHRAEARKVEARIRRLEGWLAGFAAWEDQTRNLFEDLVLRSPTKGPKRADPLFPF